jgi:prepilin-type N-terminal cleavage/methylation domain-containing protein
MLMLVGKKYTKMKNLKKGFTLIELLVVVAIIGILASVVLVLMNSARNRGDDAAIKTNLHSTLNQAELFFLDNGNSYLPLGGSSFGIAPCPVYNTLGTNMLSKNKIMADTIAEAVKRGNGSSCYNSTNGWAVAVGLKTNTNASWCVDNTGASRQVNFTPASAINPGTFLCN